MSDTPTPVQILDDTAYQSKSTNPYSVSSIDDFLQKCNEVGLHYLHDNDLVILERSMLEYHRKVANELIDEKKKIHAEKEILKEGNELLRKQLQSVLIEMRQCLNVIGPIIKKTSNDAKKDDDKKGGDISLGAIMKMMPEIKKVAKNFHKISFKESQVIMKAYGLLPNK